MNSFSVPAMRLVRHAAGDSSAELRGNVVALGNFDGVHRGHQAVIAAARAVADGLSCPLTVMSFEPHPRAFFRPEQVPFRLTPLRAKARLLEQLRVDNFYVRHFDAALAALPADAFIRSILQEELAARHVVVGYDYVFGHNRQGTGATLQQAADAGAFGFTAVAPATAADGSVYSSTSIRDHLVAGRPAVAAQLLGHPWEVEGRVEHGDHRGSQLGFPTANLHLGEYQRPAHGVYAVRAGIDHGEQTVWLNGVANYGTRPTFNGVDDRLEVHILDSNPDLYGQHLRVALLDFIRPEMRFAGIEALKQQIAADIMQARERLETLSL